MANNPRRSAGPTIEILFIGLNSTSIPFGIALLGNSQSGLELTFYTNEEDGRGKNKIRRVPNEAKAVQRKLSSHQGSTKQRKNSRKQSRRTSTASNKSPARANRGQADPLAMRLAEDTQPLIDLLKEASRNGNNYNIIRSSFELKKTLDPRRCRYIVFAGSTASLHSAKGVNLKRYLAQQCPAAVWIHLSMRPNLDALQCVAALDRNRTQLLATPLYTVYKVPAGKHRVEVKYWYHRSHPIFIMFPSREAPPRSVITLFKIFRRQKLFVTQPSKFPLGNISKEFLPVETYVRTLSTDFERRHLLLPLFLDIEYRTWMNAMKEAKKEQVYVDQTDAKLEQEMLQELVYLAFIEIHSLSGGIVSYAMGNRFSFTYVQQMIAQLEQRTKRFGADNKGIADLSDTIDRIEELRYGIQLTIPNRRNMDNCQTLLAHTDVKDKFKNKRIWKQTRMIYSQ